MGKAKQEVKARTCRVCGGTFEMSAPQIKKHAKACGEGAAKTAATEEQRG